MRKKFYPGIGQSLILLAICMGLQLLIGAVIGIVYYSTGITSEISIIILIFSSFATLLTAAFGIFRSRIPVRDYFTSMIGSKRSVLYSVMLFLGTYFTVVVLGAILQLFIPVNEDINSTFINGFNDWLGIFAIVVLAPVFEETLFRGVILRGFLKNYSIAVSIVVSALLFGLLHLNPIQSITTAVLGLALGFVFVKTGSLWMCIIFHSMFNGMSTLIYLASSKYEAVNVIVLLIIAPAIIIGIVALVLLKHMPNRISHILEERGEAFIQGEMVEPGQTSIPQDFILPPEPLRHSGLGIASFIISITSVLLDFIFFIITIIVTAASEDSAIGISIICAIVMMIGSFAALVSLCLGIAGLLDKNKKKVFSVSGIVFSLLAILTFAGVIALGLSQGISVPAGSFPGAQI